ncbi:3'(2'),5'-bisphosphate nucleotidase CysQ [Sedimentimonas flavescens]|uniref:3'(2'),5'-bisphosphate nucleotidase CysQ n=1 Tax=Sedimentimonas flavescens TaxID=2851012 RepID=A0ABT2ZYP5_9RHOB|nr:3'(2'),5'-bisphosphate nucleotidase CysQ [Sedimentimonas flavescens]MCV2878873.1 3'(2'),5'-bisphosphate nucleotidase CysQ [Sedimentimonas flavescens]
MPASDYQDDLALLTEAAKAAGEIALGYWKRGPEAWDKGGGAGPVSEADLAVNAMLERDLRAARPDYGWLSEESADSTERLAAKRVFIVDPIDGTRAFLAHDGGFAHALAMVEDGRAVAGVVHLPALELTYAAALGGPALLNGEPISPSTAQHVEGSTVLTSKLSDDPGHWRRGVPRYRRSLRPSLAWRLCLVAEGRYDATISLRPAWEWDIAAASLIAECAGAMATDRNGSPLRFNRPNAQSNGLVVAAPRLHADYIAQLRHWPE